MKKAFLLQVAEFDEPANLLSDPNSQFSQMIQAAASVQDADKPPPSPAKSRPMAKKVTAIREIKDRRESDDDLTLGQAVATITGHSNAAFENDTEEMTQL